MRLRIAVDGVSHEIDSTDPDMLGKWMVEIFRRIVPITPATWIRVEAWPSFYYNEHGEPVTDWIGDTRVLQPETVETPRDLVEALMRQVEHYEELHPELKRREDMPGYKPGHP